MIKHVVLWELKPEAEGKTAEENALEIERRLLALRKTVPQIRSMEFCLSCNPGANDPLTRYDAMLIATFDNMEDLNAYQVHPDHQAVSRFITKVRGTRAVFDCEC